MVLPTEPPTLRVDRFSFWLGPVRDNTAYESERTLRTSFPAANSSRTEPQEAAILTRGMNYDQRGFGYLHARFEPAPTGELTLLVAVDQPNGLGLEAYLAHTVLEALGFAAPLHLVPQLGAGTFTVARALVHPIDSTVWGFTRLALYLATLFDPSLDTSSVEAVRGRWEALTGAWQGRTGVTPL